MSNKHYNSKHSSSSSSGGGSNSGSNSKHGSSGSKHTDVIDLDEDYGLNRSQINSSSLPLNKQQRKQQRKLSATSSQSSTPTSSTTSSSQQSSTSHSRLDRLFPEEYDIDLDQNSVDLSNPPLTFTSAAERERKEREEKERKEKERKEKERAKEKERQRDKERSGQKDKDRQKSKQSERKGDKDQYEKEMQRETDFLNNIEKKYNKQTSSTSSPSTSSTTTSSSKQTKVKETLIIPTRAIDTPQQQSTTTPSTTTTTTPTKPLKSILVPLNINSNIDSPTLQSSSSSSSSSSSLESTTCIKLIPKSSTSSILVPKDSTSKTSSLSSLESTPKIGGSILTPKKSILKPQEPKEHITISPLTSSPLSNYNNNHHNSDGNQYEEMNIDSLSTSTSTTSTASISRSNDQILSPKPSIHTTVAIRNKPIDERVKNLLEKLDLQEYEEVLANECMSWDELEKCTESHLRMIGFKLGHIIKIRNEIEKEIAKKSLPTPPIYTPSNSTLSPIGENTSTDMLFKMFQSFMMQSATSASSPPNNLFASLIQQQQQQQHSTTTPPQEFLDFEQQPTKQPKTSYKIEEKNKKKEQELRERLELKRLEDEEKKKKQEIEKRELEEERKRLEEERKRRIQQEEEHRKRILMEEERRREEEDKKRKLEQEKRDREIEEAKRRFEEEKRRLEEERKRVEEEKKRIEEERKRLEEESIAKEKEMQERLQREMEEGKKRIEEERKRVEEEAKREMEEKLNREKEERLKKEKEQQQQQQESLKRDRDEVERQATAHNNSKPSIVKDKDGDAVMGDDNNTPDKRTVNNNANSPTDEFNKSLDNIFIGDPSSPSDIGDIGDVGGGFDSPPSPRPAVKKPKPRASRPSITDDDDMGEEYRRKVAGMKGNVDVASALSSSSGIKFSSTSLPTTSTSSSSSGKLTTLDEVEEFIAERKQEWLDKNIIRLRREAPKFYRACHGKVTQHRAEYYRVYHLRQNTFNNIYNNGPFKKESFRLVEHQFQDCWEKEWFLDIITQDHPPVFNESEFDYPNGVSPKKKSGSKVVIVDEDDSLSENENWNDDIILDKVKDPNKNRDELNLNETLYGPSSTIRGKGMVTPTTTDDDDEDDDEPDTPVIINKKHKNADIEDMAATSESDIDLSRSNPRKKQRRRSLEDIYIPVDDSTSSEEDEIYNDSDTTSYESSRENGTDEDMDYSISSEEEEEEKREFKRKKSASTGSSSSEMSDSDSSDGESYMSMTSDFGDSEDDSDSDESDSKRTSTTIGGAKLPTKPSSGLKSKLSAKKKPETPVKTAKKKTIAIDPINISTKSSKSSSSSSSSTKSSSGSNGVGVNGGIVKPPREVKKVDDVNADTLMIRKREQEESRRIQQLREARKSSYSRDQSLVFAGKTSQEDILVHPELSVVLKPHQIKGVQFMWENIVVKRKGCILAHSMGLGKSLQVISLIHTHRQHYEGVKYLLIVPANTIYNWGNEFTKWLPRETANNKKVEVYLPRDRKREISKDIDTWSSQGGVLVLTYEYYIHFFDDSKPLADKVISCDIVVIDEGHKIKSANTKTSQRISQIKTLSRVILTGYPLQNNLNEYYTMISFARPLHLGTQKEFHERFIKPIEAGAKSYAPRYDFDEMRQRLFALQTLIQDFVYRLGPEVLEKELPKKIETIISVKGTPIQYTLLDKLKRMGRRVIETQELGSLICNHPDTLLERKPLSIKDINKKSVRELRVLLAQHNLPSHDCVEKVELVHRLLMLNERNFLLTDHSPFHGELEAMNYRKGVAENSTKMRVFFSLLSQCMLLNERVVLFSSSIATLNLLEYFLQKREGFMWKPGTDYYRLDGSTRPQDRQTLIHKFNDPTNSVKLFLISTKAGSLGTNLTGGTRVILMDLMWNPVHERQAVYRCFRIGQVKPVHVYTLITSGTLEENMYPRLIFKQSLAKRAIDRETPKRQDHLPTNLMDTTESEQDLVGIKVLLGGSDDPVLCNTVNNDIDNIAKLYDFTSFFEDDAIGHLTKEEEEVAMNKIRSEIENKTVPPTSSQHPNYSRRTTFSSLDTPSLTKTTPMY